MTQITKAPEAVDSAPASPAPVRRRRPAKTRRPVRRLLIVTHRWLSLILGLVLLAITTSGAILLYRPEIQRAMHPAAYDVSGKAATVSLVQARQIVLDAHPDFAATSVWAEHGVYRVTDYETSWTVDPGTGKILGFVGAAPAWLQVLDNIHLCALSCEDYPGYIAFLAKEIPHTEWLGHEGTRVTGGGLVLGVFALLLLYLSITGIWLWFPRPGRWRSSLNIRWSRGRFARDTDLHKVGGMIAIGFLLLWAVTGTSYEFGFVEKGWYAVTPGGHRQGADPASAVSDAPDIGVVAAVAAAQRLHPDLKVVNVDLPAEDEPEAAYTLYFQNGFDPWGRGEYPGNLGVFVDRHTGEARDYYGYPDEPAAQLVWEDYNYPTHTGYLVNGWGRIVWLIMGLSPLLLAVTGISTWLVRRGSRRSRLMSLRAGTVPPPMVQTLADELAQDPEMDPKLAATKD